MVARQNELRDPASRPYHDGAESDQIKRDIDRTRAEMDETLDELGERLSPRHLLDDVLDVFRGEGGACDRQQIRRIARNAGKNFVHQVQRHPVPALLCGAGIAWMLLMEEDEEDRFIRRHRESWREPPMYSGSYVDARTGEPYDLETYGDEWRSEGEWCEEPGAESEGMTEKARHMLGKARNKLSETGHSMKESISGAKESISGMKDSISEAGARAGEKAGEFAGRVRSQTGHMTEAARRRARQARAKAGRMSGTVQHQMSRGYAYSRDRFTDAVEDYPLAVGLGFLALGALMGLSLPRTRREDELMGETSDQLKHSAREMGEELVERGKHVAEETASAVAHDAEQEGLAPGTIGEKLQHVASSALSAARQTAHEEGIAPSDIKEKTKRVAQHARETVKQTAKSEAEQQGESAAQQISTGSHC